VASEHRDSTPMGEAIAIIGMGCKFPRAGNLTEYWRLIRRGEDGISEVPPTHWSPRDYFDADPSKPDHTYCTRGGFLPETPFDPTEFGIPPTILEATDTTQLLSLVVAREALDDAGYGDDREFDRERAAVILGVTGTQELVIPLAGRLGHPLWRRALAESGIDGEAAEAVIRRIADGYVSWQENSFPGLLGNVVAGRIANRLNLRGTNCVIDAACASSLGAVHLAMMELESGRCDVALTGGADTLNDIFMHMCFSKTPALSPTGDVRPFSQDGDGTVLGEGIGMIVLKRLSDARRDGDRVYAVLRGMGSSSDGRSQSIYAPHADGQARCVRNAYRQAGIDCGTVEMIEAHGTGTKVGDATEFEALRAVFGDRGGGEGRCALGSVKSQIGHTKAAAGAAGLIKTALALYHRSIPPTIKVSAPNASLAIDESPFYLNTALRPWATGSDRPRRAGVSSFGFGGSNFHAVMEEDGGMPPHDGWDGGVQIIALSAASKRELVRSVEGWLADLREPDWGAEHLAYRASRSREAFDRAAACRLVIVAEANDDLGQRLSAAGQRLTAENDARSWTIGATYYGCGGPEGALAFVFPGQASQYVGMGRDLACTFPEMLDALAAAEMDATGLSLAAYIYPPASFHPGERRRREEALTATDVAQPAIGAICAGMLRLLSRFGVHPDMAAGHSFGELVALHAAGCYGEDEMHRMAQLRGRLMAGDASGGGAMLAIRAAVEDIDALLRESGSPAVVAHRNTPTQGVVSGPRQAVEKVADACRRRGWAATQLNVSGAFHSALMDRAVAPFRRALESMELAAPRLVAYSNATAGAYATDPAAIREALARQLTHPVDFLAMARRMHADGARCFLEVGPKAVVTNLVRASLADRSQECLAMDASSGQRDGVADFARVLARLAASGRPVDLARWERPVREPRRRRMTIPLTGANYRAPRRYDALNPDAASSRSEAGAGERKQSRLTSKMDDGVVGSVHEDLPEMTQKHEVGGVKTESPELTEAGAATDTAAMRDAPGLIQQGLAAMQALQAQTAAAHEKFLEGQQQAHRLMQDMLERQALLVPTAAGGRAPPREIERTLRAIPSSAIAIQPPPTPTVAGEAAPIADLPTPRPAARRGPSAAAAATAADVQPPASAVDFEGVVLEVVCEKTGYPREMIDLDMDIEADLGIDSIKRVEIVAAIEERVPSFGGVQPDQLGAIRTLRQILEYSSGGCARVSTTGTAAAAAAKTSAPPVEVTAAGDGEPFSDTLLAVVAQLTGYPLEMLDLDMDLEADLGIDSIKRVEILAAVEARIEDLPSVQPEMMGRLRTLREIVHYYAANEDSSAAQLESPSEPVAAKLTVQGEQSSGIRRRVLTLVELPAARPQRLNVGADDEFWITDDGTELAAAVQGQLMEAGVSSRIVSLEEVPQRKKDRPIAGFILLSARPAQDELLEPDGDPGAPGLRSAFLAARAVADDLCRAAAQQDAVFVTVSRLDGCFGLVEPRFSTVAGGLAALAKTARQEWAGVRCRAIDLAADWNDAGDAAAAIVAEIQSEGPVEIGLDRGARRTIGEQDRTALRGSAPFEANDLIVVTGGARGVTAECVVALAQTRPLRLLLLGRSPLPADEPPWLRGVEAEADIKRAIVANEFGEAGRPTPSELERAYARHMAAREIRGTLRRLGEAKAEVTYASVDVCDPRAVSQAVKEARAVHGPVRGVIHGAGRLADRLIRDKSGEQFDGVVRTKLAGLRHVLDAVDPRQLRCVAIFSSVSARYGNAGQADYAMANEALNKFARALARRLAEIAGSAGASPSPARVVSINWGPWDGGMVTEALKRQFTRRGIELIRPSEGARAFVDELCTSDPSPEVIIGAGLHGEAPQAVATGGHAAESVRAEGAAVIAGDDLAVAMERELTVADHPFLASHVLGGRPVLPVAMMIEWFAHAALHAGAGLRFRGLDDFNLLRGVKLGDPGAPGLRLTWLTGRPERRGDEFRVPTVLESEGDGGRIRHASAVAILASEHASGPKCPALAALRETAYPVSVNEAYETRLFHGPALRGIRRILGQSVRGIAATVAAAPPPGQWMSEPFRGEWLADPLAMDAALQLAILWCTEHAAAPSLPAGFERYRQYGRGYPLDEMTVAVAVRSCTSRTMTADISIIDRHRSVVAEMIGYRCTLEASLAEAFRDNRLAGAAT